MTREEDLVDALEIAVEALLKHYEADSMVVMPLLLVLEEKP